jgi:hypothetical protein
VVAAAVSRREFKRARAGVGKALVGTGALPSRATLRLLARAGVFDHEARIAVPGGLAAATQWYSAAAGAGLACAGRAP